MKNILRFHDGSIQLTSDGLLGHLRTTGAQSLHQVISHICPEYLQFSGTKRILLWSSVRNFLEKMERAGLILRIQSEPHAVWKAAECCKIVHPEIIEGKTESVIKDDEPRVSAAAVG